MQGQISIFEWRDAFTSIWGPYHTIRLVLWTLLKFMNHKSCSCFPSIDTLAITSGLSARSVGVLLKKAEEQGWITRSQKKIPGQRWALYHYQCKIPDKVRKQLRYLRAEGREAASVPLSEGEEAASVPLSEGEEAASVPLSEGEEAASVPLSEGEELGAQGAKPDGNKVPKQLPTNKPTNYPSNSSTTVQGTLLKGLGPELDQLCKQLTGLVSNSGKKFNPNKFIEDQIQNSVHHKAILHALRSLSENWEGVKYPVRYAMSIIKKINGNFNEEESIIKSEAHKKQLKSAADELRARDDIPKFEPNPEQWEAAKKNIRSKSVK